MEILHICLKSRYLLNPNSLSRLSSLSPLHSRLNFPSPTETSPSAFDSAPFSHSVARYSPIERSRSLIASRFELLRNQYGFRPFSTCLTDLSPSEASTSSNEIAELNILDVPNHLIESVVDVVRRSEVDMELYLGLVGKDLSKSDHIETLRTLNRLGLNALRFFRWIQDANPNVSRDPIVCSLMVDNFGRLGDHKAMLTLLKDFSEQKIILTEEAFCFLQSTCSTKEELRSLVELLVNMLKEANGTCCHSGIISLIKMCCAMNCFDIARSVVDTNKTEAVYYRVWLRECCLRGRFQEMREIGCDLDTRSYNYLISCLWKCGMIDEACSVLEEMVESGYPANALTFEILICQFCKADQLETAVKCFQIMVSRGIEPRLSTCSAIIKAYFNSEQYEEAYKYLIRVSEKHKCFTNSLYSLLANLHRKQGDVVVSYRLLMEMIGKGLRPDFAVYVNVSKKLYNTKRKDLAANLKNRFNSLVCQASNK